MQVVKTAPHPRGRRHFALFRNARSLSVDAVRVVVCPSNMLPLRCIAAGFHRGGEDAPRAPREHHFSRDAR